MWMSRWSRLLFALVICVAALGCSSAVDQGAGDGSAQQSNGTAADDAARQSNGTPVSPGGSPQGQSGGAAGAPSNKGNGAQAIGAPIKLPAFQQEGQPLDTVDGVEGVRQQIEDAIRKECKRLGHEDLCVTTVVQPLKGSPYHPCQFAGKTDPPTDTEGTEIYPGKVLVIYSGSDPNGTPCTPEGSSPDSGVDQQPTGSTGPTDTSQPPPDETIPPEDGQPEPTSTS